MLYVVDTCAPDDLSPVRLIHRFDVEDSGLKLTGRKDFHRVNSGNADEFVWMILAMSGVVLVTGSIALLLIPFKSLREITQVPWELESPLAGKKQRCMW